MSGRCGSALPRQTAVVSTLACILRCLHSLRVLVHLPKWLRAVLQCINPS